MSLKDIKIPADASDQQTTDAKSAIPPVEFTVIRSNGVNVISIQDRQGPQDRLATVSYRVYFLPAAFAPTSTGTTLTVPPPVVYKTTMRKSGRNVASLVTDISAPGLGTILSYTDSVNAGSAGFYFCTAVNRAGVEAPPEHMVPTDAVVTSSGATAPETTSTGGSIVIFTPSLDTTWGGTITGTINGINTGFTMATGFGTVDLTFVDGILDSGASAVGTALTVGTPPVSSVAVEHVA